MSSFTDNSERLSSQLALDVSAYTIVRSILTLSLAFVLACGKVQENFARLLSWLAQTSRSNALSSSPSSVNAPGLAAVLPCSAPAPQQPVDVVDEELEKHPSDAQVILEPHVLPDEMVSQTVDICWDTLPDIESLGPKPCDGLDMTLWQEDYKSLQSFNSGSIFDDLWPESDTFGGPEAAVTADANNVLETALASGNAKLADAALAAGVRLCSASWLTRACGQLQAAGIPLSSERAIDLMRVYGHERRADLAVDLWELHCDELGIDPEDCDDSEPTSIAELYGGALEACARAGDFETAARAASRTNWRVPPCRHGQVAFLALARWYARRQDVAQALSCYDAVRNVRGSPDLATHRAVLIASVRSADMVKADALFQDLTSHSITPDGASFSAMICGHCSAGNVERAMYYFGLLRERGIVPTAPLFDAILDGCAWMNMPALMEQVLAEMEATGVRPSTTTLSILMRLHGMNRDSEKALEVFNELPKKHGLSLDGHAYGTLISVCLKNDSYDMAWNAFERMSAAKCNANSRLYERLVAECLRRGMLEHAVRVLCEAFGVTDPQPDDPEPSAPASRVRLPPKTVEDVLRLIGRRRQAALLGVPLLEKLKLAEVEVPPSLEDAIRRSAQSGDSHPCSELLRRQEQLRHWRNFPEASNKRELLVTQAA